MKNEQADFIVPLKEVVAMLKKIGRTYAAERAKTIAELQNKIWDQPELQLDDLYFLQDLAGDFNFYEPAERYRDTALGYYDDHRLTELINAALTTIEPLLAAK